MSASNVDAITSTNLETTQPVPRSQPKPQTQATQPSSPSYTIAPVRTATDLTTTITLFTAYATSLGIDLSFQDFQTEMASMPGKYGPSANGELLLARARPTTATESQEPSEALGCVALRALPSSSPPRKLCEMKRLYVTPGARGLGLGRALARQIIMLAEALGYDEMRLDTLPTMQAAQAMYRDFGFVDIEPYCFNPVEGSRFLALRLPMLRRGDGGSS